MGRERADLHGDHPWTKGGERNEERKMLKGDSASSPIEGQQEQLNYEEKGEISCFGSDRYSMDRRAALEKKKKLGIRGGRRFRSKNDTKTGWANASGDAGKS